MPFGEQCHIQDRWAVVPKPAELERPNSTPPPPVTALLGDFFGKPFLIGGERSRLESRRSRKPSMGCVERTAEKDAMRSPRVCVPVRHVSLLGGSE